MADWFLIHGLKILGIAFAAYLFQRFGRSLLGQPITRLTAERHRIVSEEEKKRVETLIELGGGTLRVVVWLLATMMILSELGVAVGPLLAAAGIAGLALGFGGQYLIRDLISGLFLMVENQYRVGDVVCLGQTCGLVEHISLRMTTLRDLDGTVHHVPHGEIKRVANLSKNFARVNLNIAISYRADLEQVITLVNRVGEELTNDSEWREKILKPPRFLRVDGFGESALVIKILGETKPSKQWEVAGELRKRLKIAFDREKIEIPYPQRVIHRAKA